MKSQAHQQIRKRASMFLHLEGGELIFDLTGSSWNLSEKQREWAKRLLNSEFEFEESCETTPREILQLSAELNALGAIVSSNVDESGSFLPNRVDIETVRHCNAQCVYCPQSVQRKSKAVMPMKVYEAVLERLRGYRCDWVALNHYGEPLLDPAFEERVVKLYKERLPLYLFTNATLLSQGRIEFIKEQNLHGVGFNFPSMREDEWVSLMQLPARWFRSARDGIIQFLEATEGRVPVEILVNAPTANHSQRVKEVREYFRQFGEVNVLQWRSHSRAGAIKGKFVDQVGAHSQQKFAGCERISGHLHVSWEGKAFLCCNDYSQKIVLGDLNRSSIKEIMESHYVRRLRSQIYGSEPMSSSLICRSCVRIRKGRICTERHQ